MPHLDAIVKGRVQGVGFRYYVCDVARRLSIKGFVRNLPDGDVEVQAEGNEQQLRQLVDYMRKGPPLSVVRDIDTTMTDAEEGFSDFNLEF